MLRIFSLIVIVYVAGVNAFTSRNTGSSKTTISALSMSTDKDPLLLRAARGEVIERVPVWMMRQAGRHMKVCRYNCCKLKLSV